MSVTEIIIFVLGAGVAITAILNMAMTSIEFHRNMKSAKEELIRLKERDVEVVTRCKNCKHYNTENKDCIYYGVYVRPSDYCSYGVPKEKK